MNTTHTSIFSLINIFRQGKKSINNLNTAKHCEDKSIHDYYCDAEKPHLAFQKINK